MFADQPRTRERTTSAIVSGVLLVLLGWVLASGLSVPGRRQVEQVLRVMQIAPEPPPPARTAPTRAADPRRNGAAAPPNLTSKATPLVAPPPMIPLPQPQVLVVAPVAGSGADASAGAAPVPGPGSGSGGQGDGTGSGDGGDGDGGGGGTEAQLVSNKLRYRDLPGDLWDAAAAGLVAYRATIGVDGRLHDCRIVRSSGNRALDGATCALALRHVRFRPARDQRGRKVPDSALFEQEWTVEQRADTAGDGR